MSDLFDLLVSEGHKPFLNINCNSIDVETSVEAESIDVGDGSASVGLINFENLPLVPSPLPGHTIMICDSTDAGRPTINNGVTTHKLAYSDDGPGDEIVSNDGFASVICEDASSIVFTTNTLERGRFDVNGCLLLNQGNPNIISNVGIEVVRSGVSIMNMVSLNAQSNYGGMRVNGTLVAPTGVLVNQNLSNVRFGGHDGTSYVTTSCSLNGQASENWNATSHGSRIQFSTVQNGAVAVLPRVTIENNGFVGINQTIPTEFLHVNGNLRLVNGSQGASKLLQSDANGVSSWVSLDSLLFSEGALYHEDAAGTGTAVTGMVALNTPYLVDVPSTLQSSTNFTMPSNSTLRYTGSITKSFKVSAIISYANDDFGVDLRDIYWYIYKNGVFLTGSSSRFITVPGASWCTASCETLVSLATNDQIQLYVSNESPVILTTAGVQIGTMQIIIS